MGKNETPEKGDKVSWSWGGGAPAGTVAETKEQGAITIETRRGNTVKRKADPGNPAVRIERSGNDVVKRSSELTVDEKASDGGKEGTKRKAKGQDPEEDGQNDDAKNESKYEEEVEEKDVDADLELDGDEEEPHTKNKKGKEVKQGGKEARKRQKREQKNGGKEDDELELQDDEYVETSDDVTDDDNSKGEEGRNPNDNERHVAFKGSDKVEKAEANSKNKTQASGDERKNVTYEHEGDKVSARTRSRTD